MFHTDEYRGEEFLQSVFRVAPTGIGVVKDRVIVEANLRVCEMTGYTRDELLGQSSRMLYPTEEEFDFVGREKYRQINEKGTGEVESLWLRKDGTLIHVLLASTPIDINDLSRGFIFTALDISRQKEAEQALGHSHYLLQYIIEHSNSAVAVHDRDMRYLYCSKKYLEEYRVAEENLIGRSHYEVFPHLPEKWKEAHRRALAGEVLSGDDDPFVSEDGNVDLTRWECRPWYDANGAIGGVIVYTEVITERRKAELELRVNDFRLSQLAEHSRTFLWEVDDRGLYTFVSQVAEQITGYSVGELVGKKHFFDLTPVSDRAYVKKSALDVFRSKLSFVNFENPIKTKSGDIIWVSTNGLPVFDSGGVLFHPFKNLRRT